MIVTKKHLPRRTVLRGLGATLALPLLDGMVPAFAGARNEATKPIRRMMAVYVGNGMTIEQWQPAKEGALELTPILRSLQSLRDKAVVVSGLDSKPVDLTQDGGIHPRCQTAWLTGALAKKTDEAIEAGVSMDQIAAAEFGKETQLPSLELCIESPEGLSGNCAFGYGCAYNNTVSWKDPMTPLPMEANPRRVFERLFGASDTTDPKVRLSQIQKNRSILDSVVEAVTSLQPKISPDDRRKLEQYLEAVRDVERRIQMAEAQIGQELPVLDQPAGIPGTWEEHAKLQFDLALLGFQTDLTRVATFMLARELSNLAYPEVGVPDSHHPLSHHGENPERKARLAKLNAFHFRQFAYYLEKMAALPDGDGSMLDHTINFYGSGISNSNQHDPHDLPMVIVGGQALGIKGGRHIRVPNGKDNRMSNLYVTLLDKLGVEAENYGTSYGIPKTHDVFGDSNLETGVNYLSEL